MATNKTNLQVGLQFSADTSQARKQLQNLQKEFDKLATTSNLSGKSSGLEEASRAAAELAANLQLATNAETGKLDLTKFQKNLQYSGKTLKDYQEILSRFGPDGKKAFNSLADAISLAEVPLTKANKLASALWTSFKQTAKYQFTSSIYRNLIGGLRDAYSYAQDLNESLNNIRIVTGQSTDQMAKFAEEANKAARQLSVTTTQYTNGALIYYQQGLNDEEVKARTDVTMKLANASGVSAETASQQLTAIWNNFAKGSENLEYFADVMTALGASTASSTSEIAEGLEKFAAIGNTVGLSYEYAASALATVTATTRQSADVVGTAFKTLFARIQDLEVGETLEDGTTLGKYSQALATVGVNIKDANGELKAMDQILEEMAAAWQNISKDEQVALAQTVAGTRQYTQLVALMENWSFMQKNLQTSYDSTGTVQKQADIYAESWEAARARVKAAAEGIYNQLLDDTFFISLTNTVEKILVFIKDMIDGFGGLKGVLLTIGPIVLNLFGQQIDASLRNTINRIRDLSGATESAMQKFKEQAINLKMEEYDTQEFSIPKGISGDAVYRTQLQQKDLQAYLVQNASLLSEYEQKRVGYMLDYLRTQEKILEAQDEQIVKASELNDLARQETAQTITSSVPLQGKSSAAENIANIVYNAREKFSGSENVTDKDILTNYAKEDIDTQVGQLGKALQTKYNDLLEKEGKDFELALQNFLDDLENVIKKGQQEINKVSTELAKDINKEQEKVENHANNIGKANAMRNIDVSTEEGKAEARRIWDSMDVERKGNFNLQKHNFDPKTYLKDIDSFIDGQKKHIQSIENTINTKLKENQVNEESRKTVEENTKAIKERGIVSGEAAIKSAELADGSKKVADEAKRAVPALADNLTYFRQSVGVISSLTGVVNSLSNGLKILFDEEATGSQRWAAFMSILTAVSSAWFSISSLNNNLRKAMLATNVKEMAGINAVAAAKFKETLVTKILNDEELKAAAIAKFGSVEKLKEASREEVITFAKEKHLAINQLLNASLLKTIAIGAAVVAAIAVLAIVIKKLIDAHNADAIAAEKAAKATEELTKAYEEAKTAAEDLKNTIKDYDDGVNAMKKLSAGTEEYEEALKKANAAAEKLIENNPDIAWSYNANTGAIEISDEEKERVQQNQEEQLNRAEIASKIGQVIANELRDTANTVEIVRSDTNGSNSEADEREWLNKVQEIYQQTGSIEEAVKQNGYIYVDALGGKDVIKKHLDSIIKNQNSALQVQKQLVDSTYKNNTDYKNANDDVKDLLNTTLSTQVKNTGKNYNNKDLLGRYGTSYKNWSGAPKDQILAEYADYMGYTTKQNIWTGQLEIYNEKNEKVNPTYDQAKAILAQNKALEEIENSIKDIRNNLERQITLLENNGLERDKAIEFLTSWSNGRVGNLGSFTQQQLQNFDVNDYINEDIAKLLGWNYNDLINQINSRIESESNKFNDIGKSMAEAAKNAFFEMAKDGGEFIYTLADTQALERIFRDAFTSGGTEGVNKLAEFLKGQKDPVGIMSALENTDWKNADIEELYKTLTDLGYKIDYSVFEKFAQGLKTSAHEAYLLTASLEDLIKSYKELKDLLGKVQYGSVISDEEYQKLIKSRDDLKDKFIYTVDGWIYIGDTDDLNTSKSLDIDELKERNKQGQKDVISANNYDFSKSRNSDLGYFSAAGKFTTGASDEYEEGFLGFNKTAAAMAGNIDEEGLKEALAKYFDDTDKLAQESAQKIVKAYVNALVTLQGLGKKFDDENTFTLALKEQYKTVDDLIKHWNEVAEDFQDDAEKYKEAGYEVVLTNELASKGIDVKKYEAYYKYLQRINPELEYNITLARQLALANLNVQKGLENLNANYDSYIEGLTEAVGSPAHEQALTAIRQDLADILSIQVEDLNNVDEAFITEHQDLIKLASQGNEDALLQLELFAAQVVGELDEETMEVVKLLQEKINSVEIGAIVDIGVNTDKIPQVIKDMLGIETDKEGNMRSQGRWTQRANLQTLQNKSADKASKSKTLKSIDDEIDRYHYIRKLLADIKRELDRVDKAKERAYGAQHLKYIEQETDYLREQVGLQDRYINEIEGYLAKDRGLIAAYGAQFDAAGNISNYNQLFTSNFNKYANAEDSTNWENFKKALSKYEETLDLWFEQTEEKAELLRQILDKQLEGISYKVEVEVALDDREIALLEHQLDRLDDAAYDTAAALANIGEQFKNTEDSIKSTTNGIVEVLKTIPGITQDQINRYLAGDGTALAGLHIEQGQIELLEQYSDQLLELSDRLKELHDSALQKVTEAFDAWGEKIEDHVAKFEHLNNVLNNYEEIIGILGRNNLGISNEFMRAMRNQEITNLQSILNTRTQTKDMLIAQLADARQKASEAATEAEREDWEQIVTDLEGRLREATESWQQAWIDALQANKEAFEQTMQELVDSFDDYADELKRYDTAEDRYLETYRQAYELSKLGRDIQNSINDQDSIRAKKELQKLEDKINALKESGRAISENELGLLQKEYELRLAEIALEDAQNAKSLVRLERDNEGNWGYVYTADQENIEKARQDYEDKLYEYMRLADTMAEESSRAILTLNKEMAEALAALDTDAEDYEAKVAEITQFYADQINYFAEQYGISTDAMVNVARESAAKYKPEVVDIIDSDNSGLQTNFAETVLAIIGDFEDLEDAVAGPDGALPNIQRAYTETLDAFEDYRVQNARTCELAGADIKTLSGLMQDEFDSIKEKADSIDASTKTMTDTMSSYLSGVLNSFNEFATNYSAKAKVINTANEALASSIIQLEKVLQNVDAGSLDSLKKAADQVGMIAQKVKEVSNSAGNDNEFIKTGGLRVIKTSYEIKPGDMTYHYLVEYYSDGTTTKTTQRHRWVGGGAGEVCPECSAMRALNPNAYKNAPDYIKWVPVNFDTGGYTGEWGSTGRLAVLHEKELILNKEDTSNILDAVSLIRQMTAGTAQLSYGLGNIGAGLANLNLSPGTMDQNVNISASFPNVVNHNEIEEALTNLVNKASQYAFRPNLT